MDAQNFPMDSLLHIRSAAHLFLLLHLHSLFFLQSLTEIKIIQPKQMKNVVMHDDSCYINPCPSFDTVKNTEILQKSRVPHCLLSMLFLCPPLPFISLFSSLSRPRLRPIPNFGKPRFRPSSRTQALHHFYMK